jgi:SAM-dependent methyltransferase
MVFLARQTVPPLLMMLWWHSGCAQHVNHQPQSSSIAESPRARGSSTEPATPREVAFQVAAPIELEPRSYIAGQRDHYNRIYAQPESERPPPNEFLLHCLDVIDAQRQHEAKKAEATNAAADSPVNRTALDIAMGDGRNTIALAQRGYQTFGYDMSDVGINRARKRAAELGLTINAQVGTSMQPYLQPGRWDIVALMYYGVDDNTIQQLKQSIKPGGYLIVEYTTIFPAEPRREGDSTLNWTLNRFIDWEIIHYEYAIGPVQWKQKRPVDHEPAPRIRVLARRPTPASPS